MLWSDNVGNDLIERVRLGDGVAVFSNFTESRCGLLAQAGKPGSAIDWRSNGLLRPECFGSGLVQVDLRQARMVWVFWIHKDQVSLGATLPKCGLGLPNEQVTTGCVLSLRPGAAVFRTLDSGTVASSLVVASAHQRPVIGVGLPEADLVN